MKFLFTIIFLFSLGFLFAQKPISHEEKIDSLCRVLVRLRASANLNLIKTSFWTDGSTSEKDIEAVIYLTTDGYFDQFGGEKGKKFKHKQFKELILAISGK